MCRVGAWSCSNRTMLVRTILNLFVLCSAPGPGGDEPYRCLSAPQARFSAAHWPRSSSAALATPAPVSACCVESQMRAPALHLALTLAKIQPSQTCSAAPAPIAVPKVMADYCDTSVDHGE